MSSSQVNVFQGKVAIVTGAASGLGLLLGDELGKRGTVVVAADLDGKGAHRAASAIIEQGGRAESVEVDVADASQVASLVSRTTAQHRRLDYIFNYAGIAVVGELRDVTPEHWRRLVDVNLLGVVHGTPAWSVVSYIAIRKRQRAGALHTPAH
jgi:NAD(P)-dependent dehydrogenase (short-subunit alcohol dehydrogenase family)